MTTEDIHDDPFDFEESIEEMARSVSKHFRKHHCARSSAYDGVPPEHVVFLEVQETKDKGYKDLVEPFLELEGKPLPLAGRLNPSELEETLRRDVPWMESAVTSFLHRLEASLLGWSGLQMTPMLLVGPPGCGKSWLGSKIGTLLDLPTLFISAGGMADNMALKGAARGWGTARPGTLVEFIAKKQVANPLVVVDEIDKTGTGTHNGNLLDTLHQMLDPENARQWRDEFLLGRCDLSRVVWIATANRIEHLPSSLLSRFQVIEIEPPRKEHRTAMLHSLLREICEERDLRCNPAIWLNEVEWRLLEQNAKTPRQARRMVEFLLAHKAREMRSNLH